MERFLKAFMASTIDNPLRKGYFDINCNEVMYTFRNISYSEQDLISEELFLKELELINDNLNQEFLRARYSSPYNASSSKDIYFRIGSVGFNWFGVIWDFVYRNRTEIESVTIGTDYQSGRDVYTYVHDGKQMNHIPTDEFLTLNGDPIFEEFLPLEDKILLEGGTLFDAFPSNTHWLVRIVENKREDYIKTNFIKTEELYQ